MDAIITYDLVKQFGYTTALDRLNLHIPEGSIFGCVGRENAGKTTLIRLLSGLLRPTDGECTVLGLSPFFETEKLHSVVGTVLSTAKLYDEMTLERNLLFFAQLSGVDENDALDRISFLLHRLGIWESRDEKIDDLPTSVVRRASLARALVHRPRVLLMDSFTESLSRDTEDSICELISYLAEQEGVTVLLSTSDMDYAQRMCSEFALLNEGSLLAKGNLEDFRRGAGMRFRALIRPEGEAELPRGFRATAEGWETEIASEEEMPKMISRLISDGISLREARVLKPTLKEICAVYLDGGIRREGAIYEPTDTDDIQNEVPGTNEAPAEREYAPEGARSSESRYAPAGGVTAGRASSENEPEDTDPGFPEEWGEGGA